MPVKTCSIEGAWDALVHFKLLCLLGSSYIFKIFCHDDNFWASYFSFFDSLSIRFNILGWSENVYCKNDLTSILLRTKKKGDGCPQLSFVNDNSSTDTQRKVAASAWKNVFVQKLSNLAHYSSEPSENELSQTNSTESKRLNLITEKSYTLVYKNTPTAQWKMAYINIKFIPFLRRITCTIQYKCVFKERIAFTIYIILRWKYTKLTTPVQSCWNASN